MSRSPSRRRGTPTGTVEVYDGFQLGRDQLAAGKVTITIAKGLKKKGKHTLTVKYLGTASSSPARPR